ncbi:hypothetical protein AMELA_G00242690 [Ameiurus melas]|uniref:Ig-like domain-containing protein n=1 Tax=Ameiurus melas TaxID=219545 RepID=A0A7J5ZYG5_AMEME|nr:hypothetical protein AMELA_G00242690 [Ameiurus melas]
MIRFLFLFLGCFFYASADVHMLHYFYTAVPAGISFPEFTASAELDGEAIMVYKNSNRGALHISKWIEYRETEKYWKSLKQDMQNHQDNFNTTFVTILNGFNRGKVRPTASVYQKHSSPEVVCRATGFFPKTVMITWQKDGEDVHEGVKLNETLPNQDGSFQKRSILTVSAEDLQKHNYTCVIQHSSLEKEIVLEVPKGPNKLQFYSER